MRSKDFRRHQRQRLIKRIERWMDATYSYRLTDEERDEHREWARKRHSAPQTCSSAWCCGNRREIEGPTFQEVRHFDSWCEELN